jgi:N-acetylneuraminic acid mutarotase
LESTGSFGVAITRAIQGIGQPKVFPLALLALCFACPAAYAQTNEWTWINGPQTPHLAVYGTLGTPAANNLPGNRASSVGWTDSKGNLWLFGGFGFDANSQLDDLNDLWMFNPSTNQWAWMGGSNLIDGVGVSGTKGTPAAGNIPWARDGAASWIDAKGNFWLFGGVLEGHDFFNDLWEFNPATNQWAWMGGSVISGINCPTYNCGQNGVYGKLGTAAAGNTPGSRTSAVTWTDSHGNLWLFGGYGFDSTGVWGFLNDLWELNPATGQWTWMAGNNTIQSCVGDCGQPGVYGALGVPAAGNTPGGRDSATGWSDSNGNLWLLGGAGFDSVDTEGILNDLWEFNTTSNTWAWMGGSSTYPTSCPGYGTCGTPGVYGALGTAATGNIPGARNGGTGWTDSNGNLWLFGGNGVDSAGKGGFLNDFWEFNPATGQWAWMGGSSTVTCASSYCGQTGVYGTLQTAALGNIPSGRRFATSWIDTKGNLWLFGGAGIYQTGGYDYLQDLWKYQLDTGGLPAAATPTFTPGSGTLTTPQTVAIDDTTPGATISYLINGGLPTVYTTPIPVLSSETIEAIAGASGYANSAIATATLWAVGRVWNAGSSRCR